MPKILRLGLALAAPLLLTACFLTPGTFQSTLDIGRDRSFTFTYVGEVVLSDPGTSASAGFRLDDEASGEAELEADESSAPAEPTEAQRRSIIEALSREAGYRSVEYVGEGKFRVDYSISGRLDHNFVYPVNVDAMALIPWIAVEVRQDGTARMTAMAFGDGPTDSPPGVATDPNRFRDGIFTLTTDADLLMHNDEDGPTEGERTSVSWRITPTSRSAPTAVVRFAD
jgi:hypothetical protein